MNKVGEREIESENKKTNKKGCLIYDVSI